MKEISLKDALRMTHATKDGPNGLLREINVLIGDKWSEKDKALFFGGSYVIETKKSFLKIFKWTRSITSSFHGEEEWLIYKEPPKDMAVILKDAGVFASLGEARRNGWKIPVQYGYSEYLLNKKLKIVDGKVRKICWLATFYPQTEDGDNEE